MQHSKFPDVLELGKLKAVADRDAHKDGYTCKLAAEADLAKHTPRIS